MRSYQWLMHNAYVKIVYGNKFHLLACDGRNSSSVFMFCFKIWFLYNNRWDKNIPQERFDSTHDKTNKMACAPSKAPSLCPQCVEEDPMSLCVDSEDTEQAGRMHRVTWVFAGIKCNFAGFLMLRLKADCSRAFPKGALSAMSKVVWSRSN